MALTPIEIEADDGTSKVVLTAMGGATGTPAASYATTEVIAGGVYSATVAEALVGLFRYHAYTAADAMTGKGRIRLADTTVKRVTGDTDRPVVHTETILYVKIGATTQHLVKLGVFGSVVTGTPSAQLYIDNTATGAAYDLTDPDGTSYPLPITLANDETLKGKSVVVIVTATVDGRACEYFVSSSAAVTNASSDISEGVAVEVTKSLQGSVVVSEPVIDAGQISSDIVIGDDYLAAKGGRAFEWVVPSVSGVTAGTAQCFFGLNGGKKGSAVVEGTVTDEGDGTWKLSFDLPRTATQSLEPGEYSWSVAVHDTDGTEITRVRNRDDCYRVRLVEKQT